MRADAALHRAPHVNPAPVPGVKRWMVPGSFSALAALALACGMLVYMTDRNAARVLLLPNMAALDAGPLFGALGQWLPSFVHPFAFSLLSAAARPRSAAPAYGVCAAWWAVNIVFEVGQHELIGAHIAEFLQRALGRTGLARTLANYFLHGTFDAGDIMAATAGALAAALVIYLFHRLEAGHAR